MNLIQTLNELIAIPSVNPMGRDLDGPEYLEDRLTDHLQQVFEGLGLPTLRQRVEPRRENILARLDGADFGKPADRLLLWDVHQDTVPVDGMTIEPFVPTVKNGRLYGRGSCDVKGSMAAMINALARLALERPAGMPTLVMACTVNEEHGFTGATELTRLWSGDGVHDFLGRRPDACIVAEPTRLHAVVSHKGVVRWRCHTTGRAAHSSQPQCGENAIYQMGPILQALQTYAEQVVPALGKHPLCGQPSLSVGMIAGGMSVNTVPERCTIDIDRRLLPSEEPTEAYQHVIDNLAATGIHVTHDPPYMGSTGLADDNNSGLANSVCASARGRGIDCQRIGVAYGTNAPAIASSGVPTVVFGPGCIDQAHTADEWIDVEQLQTASEIFFDIGARSR